METVANQIYKKYKSISEFARYCHDKYGVDAKYLAKCISSGDLSPRSREIMKREGVVFPEEEDRRKDRAKEYVADYLKTNALEIRNWRAGL